MRREENHNLAGISIFAFAMPLLCKALRIKLHQIYYNHANIYSKFEFICFFGISVIFFAQGIVGVFGCFS